MVCATGLPPATTTMITTTMTTLGEFQSGPAAPSGLRCRKYGAMGPA